MICEKIKELRIAAGFSQAELARRLDVTRSSVNAWEMGLSAPTMQYLAGMCRLFHVSADYLLETESGLTIRLDAYRPEEVELVFQLLKYFDSRHKED